MLLLFTAAEICSVGVSIPRLPGLDLGRGRHKEDVAVAGVFFSRTGNMLGGAGGGEESVQCEGTLKIFSGEDNSMTKGAVVNFSEARQSSLPIDIIQLFHCLTSRWPRGNPDPLALAS